MTIHKSETHIDVYRLKARARDINELSGRSGRADLTRFVNEQMLARLHVPGGSVFVDVGCGEGSSLARMATQGFDAFHGRLIGILPTLEEVSRVRRHLLEQPETMHQPILIQQGRADQTHLPSEYVDVLVSNGVLIVLGGSKEVAAALSEFRRITKPGATLFIGEVPDCDEFADRRYGDSISGWLAWVLKTQGAVAFLNRLRQTMRGLVSREPFIVGPKVIFHLPPAEFIGLLARHGFSTTAHFRHREIDAQGRPQESSTRWNYLARRTQ